MLVIVPLLFVLAIVVEKAQGVTWYIEPCRLTTSPNGTFTLCEQKADCASEVTGSTVECSQYTYVTLSLVQDCITICCYELSPVPSDLNGTLVKECYDQSERRRALYVVKIVFIVSGCLGLVVAVIGICVFGFVTNPYTGKRVYVGCCCCKKVPDFERERN